MKISIISLIVFINDETISRNRNDKTQIIVDVIILLLEFTIDYKKMIKMEEGDFSNIIHCNRLKILFIFRKRELFSTRFPREVLT